MGVCSAAVKANWILGCTRRDIASRDTTIPLYSVLVRPHLRALCPFLASATQERHRQTGKGPKEGH